MRPGSGGEGTPRSTPGLALRSLLAALWFALVFFVAFPAAVLRAAGADLWPPPGASLALGLAIIALAHVALVPHVVDFVRRGRGTHAPFDPPRTLILGGLYRWIRNPMYLLYAGVALGEAILYRSAALLGYAVAFWGLMHLYVVGVEEKQLRRRFGAAYEDYCRRVGRWLPRRRAPP